MSLPGKGKQYGLIMPKKARLSAPRAGNIFGDDNGSDKEDGTDWVQKALKAEGEKNRVKKQTQLNMQKALKENPSIYQYDEIYDQLERTKAEEKAEKKQEVKMPKYIHNLLKAADRRKREQEHRIERMVQKEREAEGEMFADKESFVTSAYRAKLEELKKMEEEELRMERLEAIGDVTKQQDMSGFYRHLYRQTVAGGEKGTENEERVKKSQQKDTTHEAKQKEIVKDDKSLPSASQVSEKEGTCEKTKKTRQYRQRVIETAESDEEDVKADVSRKAPSKLKEDNVKSEPAKKKQKLATEEPNVEKEDKQDKEETLKKTKEEAPEPMEEEIDSAKQIEAEKEAMEKKKLEDIERRKSILKKRTVGAVFEAALQRYHAGKAAKLCAT